MSHKHEKYQRLIDAAKALQPVATAVAHPCDESSLTGAVDAAKLGLIRPILVGPKAKIQALAKQLKLDLAGYELVDAPHSHAAAAKAVELVRAGKAEALMKGALHTDELMAEVVRRDTGLRTARRISHCFVMDVPSYDDRADHLGRRGQHRADAGRQGRHRAERDRPARALRFPEARVAILSAMETVNPKVASTVEAAALCKMADRGQITGGILDGPLALDNAINLQAASIKKIVSPVAGRANVLIVPDLEAGNMLAKSLSFLAQADSAGIVLGAKVPIILTSRADSVMARLASCAVASLVASLRRESAAEGDRRMSDAILVLNAGSSSIKFSLFGDLTLIAGGQAEAIQSKPRFVARDAAGKQVAEKQWPAETKLGHEGALAHIVDWLKATYGKEHRLAAVGHRVVHGGADYSAPVLVDGGVLAKLERFIPLAPLHQPHNLAPIRTLLGRSPQLPQVACFDTAMHRSNPPLAQMFALPMELTDAGVRRYGFHGLSYEYIASVLPQTDARAARGRTVVLHLGNGASMCALQAGRSVASTMGFTAVDGLPMGTRCGAIDPGVILYLMDERGMDARASRS